MNETDNEAAGEPSDRKQRSHQRILQTASRAIRRRGFQGVGVADIMKEAGLTHGGFYAHFASRDAMLAAALGQAGDDAAAKLSLAAQAQRAKGAPAFKALVEGYLSERHLADVESGCPVAALVSEVPHQADIVREAAAQRVQALIDRVRDALPPGREAEAAAVASQLVGALQLARALGPQDGGKALLASVRRGLLDPSDRRAA